MTGADLTLGRGPRFRRRDVPLTARHVVATGFAVAAWIALASPAARAHEDPGFQIEEVSAAIEAHPDDASLYLRRAELHRLRGEWADGVSDLQKTRNLDPSLDVVDLALARLLLGAGDAEPALAAIDRFVAAHDGHAGAHLVRARLLVRLGRRAEADREFSRGIELALGDAASGKGPQPDDYLERARNEAAQGSDHVDEAVRGLDEGAAALGGAIALELAAIDFEVSRERWDSALARLAAIEARSRRKETWAARRGDILLEAGRDDDAKRAYAEALAAIDRLPAGLKQSAAVTALASRVRGILDSSTQPGVPAKSPASASSSPLPPARPAS